LYKIPILCEDNKDKFSAWDKPKSAVKNFLPNPFFAKFLANKTYVEHSEPQKICYTEQKNGDCN